MSVFGDVILQEPKFSVVIRVPDDVPQLMRSEYMVRKLREEFTRREAQLMMQQAFFLRNLDRDDDWLMEYFRIDE